MAASRASSGSDWSNYWAMVPRYERWIESLGVPIHRAHYVQDIRTVEVGPWEERECNAAVIVLEGNKDFMETRITEIPPGSSLRPAKYSFDDIVYVASGQGLTTIWAGDGAQKRTFEWGPRSVFFVPRNYTYQVANAQGHQAVRLFHYNYLPMAMSITPNPAFFFDNPALEPDVDLFSDDVAYSQATYVEGAGRARGTWVAVFFPDLMAWDKTRASEGFAPGSESLGYCFPNVTSLRMGGHALASGTYKRAHYHGEGAVIVIPGGEGMSAMWPVPGAGSEDEMVIVRWHEGTVFGPPNLWYHMHANVGAAPARYITLHPARHIEPSYPGSNLPYADEPSIIRTTFEAELAKSGLSSKMPPQVYADRTYLWYSPEDEARDAPRARADGVWV
ncbi:MAG: cupin domain-containing protein [Chloroflexi bacterium]|nr:cupin domain-containing protein [Chloroflexota bacterium]